MKENNMMSYEMYEDFKETMVKTIKTELSARNSQSCGNDLPQLIREAITQLTERLESIERSNIKTQAGIDNLRVFVESIEIPAELPPRITQHRISLAIESKGVFWAMIGMMATIVLLCTMLYWTARPNYDRIDNDLKYRYIKMKGEATSDRIAELEEIFELHRDNAKIREMKKDVETFEKVVKQKAVHDEQVRLNEQAAKHFEQQLKKIKAD